MQLHVAPRGAPALDQLVWMQADLDGQWSLDRIHVNSSIGYVPEGDLPAALTHSPDHNVISRVHWIGVDLDSDQQWMLRAGRINLPFGIRSVEHTLWVRVDTRTDTDATQEDGVALAFNGSRWRARYSGSTGTSFSRRRPTANVAMPPTSSMRPLQTLRLAWIASSRTPTAMSSYKPSSRQAHGVFLRWAPARPVVLSTEWALTVSSQPPTVAAGATQIIGTAGMLSADVEPVQGFISEPRESFGPRRWWARDQSSVGRSLGNPAMVFRPSRRYPWRRHRPEHCIGHDTDDGNHIPWEFHAFSETISGPTRQELSSS